MLVSCLSALLYVTPAFALLALMRTTLLPEYLREKRFLHASVEAVLWVVGIQVLAESVILANDLALLRASSDEPVVFSPWTVMLRTLVALPVFMLPVLLRTTPVVGIASSLLWAILLGQASLIESTFGIVVHQPIASVRLGFVQVTPVTFTYFLAGALWFLSVQRQRGTLPGLFSFRGLERIFSTKTRSTFALWLEISLLYGWVALGLIFASVGSLSLPEVRVQQYGLVLSFDLASILLSFWMLWNGKDSINRLMHERDLFSTRQISELEHNLFMRQKQIVRMLSGAHAGAIFWQANHAHVQTGSQNWRRGLIDYRVDAIELPVALHPNDNLEVFFRKCLTVAEFERLAVALDSVFLGDETQFELELEGALMQGGQHTYKVHASALRSQSGPGILFLDILILNFNEEKNMRQQLQSSAQIRKETLFSVGHDLGSPLGLIRMSVNMLRRHLEAQARFDDYANRQLSRVDASVLEAHAYLKNALDFAQSDQENFRFPQTDLKPAAWLREITDKQRAIYGIAADRVRLEVASNLVLLQIQEQAFQMIAVNLISNAFKYGSSGEGTITIRLAAGLDANNRPGAVFEVADQGCGIPACVRAALYQPFRRGVNAGSIGGTGLGLTIVRRGVECLGGTIEIVSAQPGTHFRVRMPVQLMHEQAEIPA